VTTNRPYHLYVVGDDQALRKLLVDYFLKQGLAVTAMASAEDMLLRIGPERPDFLLLDAALPGMSGIQACQRLRGDGNFVPIILLTAGGDEVDRVVGLEMGADDYLTQPVSSRELLARIRAVLRRGTWPAGAATVPERSVRIGQFTFMPASRSLHRGQEVRVLNSVEYALLSELTARPGLPVARERLLEVSHKGVDTVLIRAVDAAIMRLRRLLEPNPASPRYIHTVRFQGYMFVPHDVAVS
jgi:two-component system phosphate regulon response regulator OmpR